MVGHLSVPLRAKPVILPSIGCCDNALIRTIQCIEPTGGLAFCEEKPLKCDKINYGNSA